MPFYSVHVRRHCLALVAALGVGCSAEVTGPTPVLDGVNPGLVCNDQLVTELIISGEELSPLAIEAATDDPLLAIPDITLERVADLSGAAVSDSPIELPNDPENPSAARIRWIDEMTMAIEIYSELNLVAGVYRVTVTNRNGRSATLENGLAVVDPPSLTSVVPDLICNAEEDRTLTLTGSSFLSVDGTLPEVTIGDETFTAVAVAGCSSVAGPVANIEICTELTVVTPQNTVGIGDFAVFVGNPSPAGCSSVEDVTMAIVPEPTLGSVEPDLFCAEDGSVTLTLTGSGFIDIDGELPMVLFDGTAFIADNVANCTPIVGTLLSAQSCTELTVTVPQDGLAPAEYAVSVENPQPAGCTSNESVTALVLAAPVITSVEPMTSCDVSQPATITITGEGFLRIDDGMGGFVEPTVTVDDGNGPVMVTVSALAGCVALTGGTAGEICTSLTFDVPAGGFAVGSYTINITNPPPADCQTATTGLFDITTTPIVVGVQPFKVCGAGDTFTVTGTSFGSGSEILVDGTAVPTMFVSDTELTGTIEPGFAAGLYDISVSNGVGCDSNVLVGALTVVDAPIVFFVDPPNVFADIDVRLTIWVSGIQGANPTVSFRLTGTMDAPVLMLNPVYDGANRILATLPAGTAAGDYDILITDDPCPAEIINALHVTDTPTVHISSIEPPFGVDDEVSGVTVRSDDPTPVGFENFEQTPRAYLNPVLGGTASELRAVSFLDSRTLTAVVPSGLPAGVYQLIVVNPDGHVGVLDDAFTVLPSTDPPPEITDLLPGLAADQTGQDIDVIGLDFPTNSLDVEVTAVCRDPGGGPDASITAVVNSTSANLIDTTWDMSGLAGYVCVVRVSNLANGTYFDFSAISVTNSSGNINSFVAGPGMVEARRALGAAAIRQNAQARFLFAIGGDEGDDNVNPVVRHASVESATVDPFGAIGKWEIQRNALPESRAFSGTTTIGRHVYVVGGRTGADPGTVDGAVLRAFLLDPFAAPEINDLTLLPGGGVGLDGGIWYYFVSAVMDPADPNNPGGEALPSEPRVIQLPDLPGKAQITLFWDEIPGAVSYRIYRTVVPDQIQGDERFLAEIPNDGAAFKQSFTDDGTIDNSAETSTPLPLGSLGVWSQVATLNVAREGAAVVAVPHPTVNDTNYLYVIGGLSADGTTPLTSYEFVEITAPTPSDQTLDVGGFQLGTETLDSGRWQIGAVRLDAAIAPTAVVAGDAWVYVLKGMDESLASVNEITTFQVDPASGELVNKHDLNAGGNFGGGYGAFAGNDVLFVFGAAGGSPSDTGRSGSIVDATTCPADCHPALQNLNAGFNLDTPRYLHAAAFESAFIFLLGGETNVDLASRSTERTNL